MAENQMETSWGGLSSASGEIGIHLFYLLIASGIQNEACGGGVSRW